MPFWNLDLFNRYFPQINTIAKKCSLFHLVYLNGDIKKEWLENIMFHKVRLLNIPTSNHFRFLYSTDSVYGDIKDIDVDLYYSLSGVWMQWYSSYFGEMNKKPFVLRLRGDDREVRKNLGQNRIKRKFFEHFNGVSFRKAHCIIPISNKLIPVAKSYGVKDDVFSEVVANGINTDMFKFFNTDRDERFTVGYAGRISKEKGSRLLEFLTKWMNEVDPEIKFLVAGDLQDEIKFYDNTQYMGKLLYEEMPYFYNMCDMIILPSLSEGFPNAILEAYSSGKPILCTTNAFPCEIPLYGNIMDFCCVEWIKEILGFKEEGYNKETGEIISKYVQNNYSWDKYGNKMISIFEKIKKIGYK